jgi:pimeloyl-ACP methyl ester carboxylesterase
MTMACSSGRLSEPSFQAMLKRLAAPGISALAPSTRELGPSYRAANPDGVAQWEALERGARTGGKLNQQPPKNPRMFADIEKIRTPALLMPGSSDLVAAPTVMLTVAAHLQRVEVAMLTESGHQGYWEQPIAYNETMLAFLRKHRG